MPISELVRIMDETIDFCGQEPYFTLKDVGISNGKSLLEIVIYFSLNRGNPYQLQLWRGGVHDPTDSVTRNYGYCEFRWTARKSDFVARYGQMLAISHAIQNYTKLFPLVENKDLGWKSRKPMNPDIRLLLALTAGIIEHDRHNPLLQPQEVRESNAIQRVLWAYNSIGNKEALHLGPERLAFLARSREITTDAIEVLNALPTDWLGEVFTPMLVSRDEITAISLPSEEAEHKDGERRLISLEKPNSHSKVFNS